MHKSRLNITFITMYLHQNNSDQVVYSIYKILLKMRFGVVISVKEIYKS